MELVQGKYPRPPIDLCWFARMGELRYIEVIIVLMELRVADE